MRETRDLLRRRQYLVGFTPEHVVAAAKEQVQKARR
jgi:hypothetical protein